MMDEQRRSERRSAAVKVEVTEHVEGRAQTMSVLNLAADGAYFGIKKPSRYNVGQIVTLSFALSEKAPPLLMTGEVVRIVDKNRARGSRSEPGIAVEFVTTLELPTGL